MKPGKPLKRTGFLPRKTPMRQVSPKRAREDRQWVKVKAEVNRREGRVCWAADVVPEVECRLPLDADHWDLVSANPGARLDPANVHLICRAHHDWKHDNPVEAAHRGLRPYPRGYLGPRPGEDRPA